MRKICSLAAKKKTDIIILSLLLILISLLSAVLADPITSTQADGLLVYSEHGVHTSRYRLWNESNDFSAELTGTPDTGGDIQWVVVRGAPTRDEMLVGLENDQQEIHLQIFNSSDQWHNSTEQWNDDLELSTGVPNAAYRAFDIAYESLSGDALIVYENVNTNDNVIAYRIWNGSNYTAEQTFTTSLTTNPYRWVALTPRIGTDGIMLLVHNGASDLYAVPWNGTAFDSSREQILSEGTTSNGMQHFAFAWEESSGAGLVGYGEGNNFVYRTYSPTAPFWSTEATIALGNGLNALRMCSEPTSDYIGIIWQDAGNDVQARVWDGTQILSSPPSEEGSTEANGASNVNVDCAWFNSSTALFGFTDLDALSIDYFTFTKANTWSTSDLEASTNNSGDFAADDIKGLRFVKHPKTSEVMVVEQDLSPGGDDIRAIRWNGTQFNTPTIYIIETDTEPTSGGTEAAMFEWYRYDPVPTVSNINPSGINFTPGATIVINATVTDNIAVGTVLANVTLPNGTILQLVMTDGDTDTIYNTTFTGTTAVGTFIIRIIANDTDGHVNRAETVTFTVSESIPPNVTAPIPGNGTIFNVSQVITIAANVTDNVAVSAVSANVTLPNGTASLMTLIRGTGAQYNSTFTIPLLIGRYNITFIANDTTPNINDTATTYFFANDTFPPNVSTVQPTNVNEDTAINYNATVADNIALSSCSLYIGNINNGTMNISAGVANRTVTFSTPGTYTLVANCTDSSGNHNDTSTTPVTVNDTTSPTYEAALNVTPTSFASTHTLNFTLNWTDNFNLTSAWIEVNRSGTLTLYQVSNMSATVWNLTLSGFPAGTHYWRSNATDSQGNVNTTGWYAFTIAKIAPTINLSVNGTAGAVTIDEDSPVWLNGTILTGDSSGNLTLWRNTAFIAWSQGSIANLSTFETPGTFNISLNYTSSENYTAAMVSHIATVNDITPPAVTNLVPIAGTQHFNNTNVTLSADITDNVNVSHGWVNVSWANGSLLLNLTLGTSPTYSVVFPSSNTSETGVYNVTFFANDTSANLNSTVTTWFNVTVVPDTTPPSWANASATPASPATYSKNTTSRFNVTWTDAASVDTVLIEHNFIGTLQNYTVTTHADAIYYYTYGPAVGTYVWRMYANDSVGNANVTDQYTYNITRAAPTLTITNNTAGNTTYGNATNVTCAASSGQVTPVLYRNGTQITNGEAVILAVGTWLFACNSSQTANYTDATATSLNITLAKATPTINLTLNGTAGAVTIDEDSPVWLNGTIITGDSSGNLTLWRGTTFIAWNQGSIANLSTFDTPGTYNISLNYTASENYTSAIVSHIATVNDITPPAFSNAFNWTPAAFNTSGQLHFNLTWADWNMSSAWLQVNRSGAILNYTMSNVSATMWNLTIASDFPAGTHAWRSNATDGAGNLNITSWYAFTIPKAVPVLNLTLNGTAGAVTIDEGSSIWLNGSIVSGDADVANLTLYLDATFKAWNLTRIGNLTTFSAPGIYNVSLNYTPTENYTAGMTSYLVTVRDTTPPGLALNAPAARFNTTSQTVQFNFTATDTFYTSLNCSLVLDSVTNYTNATTQNGTATVLSIASLAEGQHYWNVTCTDTAGNSNVSATRQFTIDSSAPRFLSLTTDPSTADDLDPNLNITVIGNATDNFTQVHTVTLQRRLSTASVYTNQTMVLNSTTGLYEAIFNATSAGLYYFRLIANDTVGNSGTSNLANVTVAYDYTWTRTPTDFDPVSADPYGSVTVGNLTINNTGDYTLNFTVTSSSNQTVFNGSANFSLTAKGVMTLAVNDTANTVPVKTFTLNITATPNGDPSSQTVGGTIVAAPGQPVLVATFTTPVGNTMTLTRGDTHIAFVAQLQNIGQGNASNVTFTLTLPADWSLTYGSMTRSFDEFYSGDEGTLAVEVDIPSNATSGTRYVVANTTGVNGSSANLTSLGLTFADVVTVTVNELATLGALDEEEETPVQQASGGGYPPATLAGIFEKVLTGEELLYSAETFELVRGYDDSFPVVVKNIFDTTTLYNVTIRVEGYLSQYITVSPRVLDKMAYGQSKSFNISIISPDYMEKGTYDLTVIITGKMLGTGIRKDFIEKRKVTLVIHTVGEDEASGYIEETLADIGALEAEGITSARLSALLAEAEKGLAAHDYDGVKSIAETVKEIKETALVANNLIQNVKAKMVLYKATLGFLLQTSPGAFSETQALLNLATAAFERGDYETALQRMGDAQLALALERSDYATLFFLVDHWLTLLLITVIVCLEGAWGYKRYVMLTISRRILNLHEEEETLMRLMREAQEAYFMKKSIGPDSFHSTMDQYCQRLSRVRQLRSQLRHRRVRLLRPERLLHDLELERADVTGRLKALQKQYFVTRNISKRDYEEQSKAYNERMAEIEDEQWSLEF